MQTKTLQTFFQKNQKNAFALHKDVGLNPFELTWTSLLTIPSTKEAEC